MNKQPITVLITTYNEALILDKCLEKLYWADEILIVDSYSTDATIAIASAYGAKIISRKYDTPATQKNVSIPLSKHVTILLLDADEVLTEGLIEEIITAYPTMKNKVGSIGRENYFLDKMVRFSGWQNDKVVRLINRDVHRFHGVSVHESIDIQNCEVVYFKNKMQHYTYKNIPHFIAKIQRYATYRANENFIQNKKVSVFQLYFKPIFRFIRQYIFKLGFLDGKVGLIVCTLAAYEQFLRAVFTLELFENQKKNPS